MGFDKNKFLHLFCQHVPAETPAQKGKAQAGLAVFEDTFAGLIKATNNLFDVQTYILVVGLGAAMQT